MAESPLRIAIADDHPIFRAGLRQLLETESHCSVAGEASDGAETVAVVERERPDLLLLDYSMPRGNGLDVLRELGRRGLKVRTVILTADINPGQVIEALKLGAAGVMLKSAATELLFRCVRAVLDAQYGVDRGTTGDLGIAEQTVKNHLSQLYERLGVTSRLGLAVYARERGLI